MSLTRWVRPPCRLWCLSLPLNTSQESLECWNRTMDTPFLLVSTVVLISPIVSLTNLLSFRSVLHHPFPLPFLHVSPQSRGSLAKGPSKPRESLAVWRAKEVLSFLSYFKTLSISPASGIEPTTSALQSRALPTELILPWSSTQISFRRK